MAGKSDGRRRAHWTVEQLDLEAGDSVLEVGCGPGLALEAACQGTGPGGRVVGVDRSELMVKAAAKRLRRYVEDGRLELRVGTAEELPRDESFDHLVAINSVQFWSSPVETLANLEVRRAALTFQPPWRSATASDSRRLGESLVKLLETAGFSRPRLVIDDSLDGAPAACAVGERDVAAQPEPRQ